jgi:hypothetical protein|tara:strand:+ start:187 stop:558 length:372 start_codon:yes stop_codon:yes gene_type:complete
MLKNLVSRQKRDDSFVRDDSVVKEGGGLDANALAAMDADFKNKKAAVNGSDASGANSAADLSVDVEEMAGKSTHMRTRDRDGASSDAGTQIDGLAEFDKYGRLFQDLTTRNHIDTQDPEDPDK